MGLPPLSKIPLILRPQAWLHRRHYGEVLSPIRWWGRIPFIFYLVSMFVGWLERKRSPLDPVVRSLVSARIAQMCLCEFCVDIGIGEENRKRWLRTGKCSFLPEEREWMDRLMSWGLVDTFRHANPQTADRFSWFDYRSKGFDDNRGLRIDLLLASQPLAECCVETGIDYEIRSMEKPSDHAPVWATFRR